MSTNILYHGFGIQGYQHVHTKIHDGAIHFRVRQEVFNLRCPICGSSQVQAPRTSNAPVWYCAHRIKASLD